MKYLEMAWRFAGTMLFYLMFAVVGLLVGAVVMPLIALFVRRPAARKHAARAVIYGLFRVFVAVATTLRLIAVDFTGLEHRNAARGQLVLANHPSLIDVVILLSVLPQVDCVVKAAVMHNPVLRVTAKAANYISNEAPDALLAECVTRLERGASLILFPEGTRSVHPDRLALKPGAAEVAIRASAELLPVIIHCEPLVLAKNDPWYIVPPRRPHFRIRFLAPIPVREIMRQQGVTQAGRHVRHQVNEALTELFETELGLRKPAKIA